MARLQLVLHDRSHSGYCRFWPRDKTLQTPRCDARMYHMVRSERCSVLTGESPVRVCAGAPGSRLQPGGEIRPGRAECQKPFYGKGAKQRAATISERNSLVTLLAERCLEGRAAHVTAKATGNILDRNGPLSRVPENGTHGLKGDHMAQRRS
jgi:hypothetical protein